MAQIPVFFPDFNKIGVIEKTFQFQWFPGMSKSQKQKNVISLHESMKKELIGKSVLEVSTKSLQPLGVSLSAFNLSFTDKEKGLEFTVESAYQSGKVFSNGGPYSDLMYKDSLSAKRDYRLKESGPLTGYKLFNTEFPLYPEKYFYSWLYINTLIKNIEHNKSIHDGIIQFDGFTDIEFNPKKSINCQAYTLALYVSIIIHQKVISGEIRNPEYFLKLANFD